jgi:hypothetical protein
MAHRWRFTAATQKVSQAGVDVLTATGSQLLFDGAGAAYNGLLASGVALASAFLETSVSVSNPGGSTGTRYTRVATIGFGRDLGYVPRVIVGFLDPTDSAKPFSTNCWFDDLGRGGGSSYNTGSVLTLSRSASSSSLTITIVYLHYDGAGFTRALDIPYLIFQV